MIENVKKLDCFISNFESCTIALNIGGKSYHSEWFYWVQVRLE